MDELLAKALPVEGGDAEDAEPKWDLPAQSAASYLKMVSLMMALDVRLDKTDGFKKNLVYMKGQQGKPWPWGYFRIRYSQPYGEGMSGYTMAGLPIHGSRVAMIRGSKNQLAAALVGTKIQLLLP